jgi:hypothetical protein
VAAGQRCHQTSLLAHPCLPMRQLNFTTSDALSTMSQDDKLIDLNSERAKRVHDLNEKRLNEVRQAFEQAMPLGKAKKKPKNKPKKR